MRNVATKTTWSLCSELPVKETGPTGLDISTCTLADRWGRSSLEKPNVSRGQQEISPRSSGVEGRLEGSGKLHEGTGALR